MSLTRRKDQTNPDWGTFCETPWPVLFKNVEVRKDKERLKSGSRLKKAK